MSFEQITIVGVGLIGGSVGLAARANHLARCIVGVDRDSATLKRAHERGAIDIATSDLAAGVRDAGLVVLGTPVDRIGGIILQAATHCRPGTIFTDVGSTKANIIAELAGKLREDVEYVPSHPLAGAERNGPGNALPDLFLNRTVILTPTAANTPANIERVAEFWKCLGSRVVFLPPDDHDRILGMTSHLPHAVASAVAGVTPVDVLPFSAGGFRDVTRIAAGDPGMWAAIFQANRESVLAALAAFTDRLAVFRSLLEAGDGAGVLRWLSEAKKVRDALGC